jgi:ribonuclease HII
MSEMANPLDRWEAQALIESQWGCVAGCDEAGRGPLVGPVACAAVVLKPGWSHPLLRDSKKLSALKRDLLADEIREHAISFSVVLISAAQIDAMNILAASLEGMSQAIEHLNVQPHCVYVDGNRPLRRLQTPQETWVKGDDRLACIAAASILAKTARDAWMLEYAKTYTGFGFESNMGYPTKEHLEAIDRLGITPEHRRTFKPIKGDPRFL